jgi:hypothetical protein
MCLLSTLFIAGPAAAGDKDAANALFDKGIDHMEAGRYDQACPAFAESYRINPSPGTLFTLAECEAKRGRIATAVARYDEYLALYPTLPPDKKAKQGTRQQDSLAQKAALGPQVPELTLLLPEGAPPQTVVKRDGAEIAAAVLGFPMPVDPGEHIVTTQAPGGPVTEIRVTLGKAEKQKITLQWRGVLAVPPAIPPKAGADSAASGHVLEATKAPPDREAGGHRIGVYVAGGIGIAGLVLGGITGGLMLSKKGTIDEICTGGSEGVKLCKDASGVDAGNSAKTLGLVSTIGFGVGVAGLGVATVLFVMDPSRDKSTTGRSAPSPRESPRWISAGVLSAGQGSAIVGCRGVW